ncbi:methyl-accepting chemotaxis protein [Rhizobium helianthi]
MTVNQRLLTLGVTAFLGMGAIIGVGWFEQSLAQRSLDEAATVRQFASKADSLHSASLELTLAAMDTIIDKDEGAVQPERVQKIKESTTLLRASSQEVAALAAAINKPELAQSYSKLAGELSQQVETELPRLVASRASVEEFAKVDDVIDSSGDELTELLAVLSAEGKSLADAKTQAAQDKTEESVLFQFLCGGLAMMLVGALQYTQGGAIRRALSGIASSMQRIADGDCETPVAGTDGRDELASMARSTERFRLAALEKLRLEQQSAEDRQRMELASRERLASQEADSESIRFATQALAEGLTRLRDGDLSVELKQPFRADLEPIRADFNRLTEQLRAVMQEINQSSSSIQANSQQMRSAADDLAKRTEQQAASLEETSAALEQITRTVRTATERAEGASKMVSNAKDFAESSSHVVNDAMAAMERIEQATGEIGKIINVVDEIAFQTNLLALNAGVEAARAGEAGKGFAVVAQEVRELAGRAAGAAKDIKALVTRSSTEVQTGVELVRATGDALHRIGDDVLRINDDVSAIVTSAREQFTGLSEINSAIGQMDQTTQQNAAMVEETNASSHTLAADAETLSRLMRQFRVEGSRPVAVQAKDAPPVHRPSPARNLMNRVASAITSSAAARVIASDTKEKWEEF